MPKPVIRTPDGRYLVIMGKAGPRLWRVSNPGLSDDARETWVRRLMDARRSVRDAKGDPELTGKARLAVDEAKRALGERGPPWWKDGTPDFNRVQSGIRLTPPGGRPRNRSPNIGYDSGTLTADGGYGGSSSVGVSIC